ncbi:MAG: isocitrate lyase/phosphoenolpyruvate mutase family protein, partial [Alphaproteobacteria bacterium]|nr:isocitrate lyase/phosphoenolpyruvate mutase family protein [Alphaproteobacteria bacterium]
TPGRRVIPIEQAAAKIRVAAEARDSRDFLIIARTDARTDYGLDEALRRAEAFAEAGADILFVEAPETVEEMERIGKAFDQPLLVNVVEGGKTPVLSAAEYAALGYQIAIFPALGFLAMGAALESVYGTLKQTGASTGVTAPLADFMPFSKAMGFEDVWRFEREHASLEAAE